MPQTVKNFKTLLLAGGVALLYGRAVRYPFIEDDWCVIRAIVKKGGTGFPKNLILPAGKLLYRPLGQADIVGMTAVFGLNATPFHIAALVLHFANSLLISIIAGKLLDDPALGWISGFLYAFSLRVHVDNLLWVVGIYDLGGTFFLLISFALFMAGRRNLSAFIFFLATLLKETTLFFPALLLLYGLKNIRSAARDLAPHAVALTVYALLRLQGESPLGLPQGDSYRMELFGAYLLKNMYLYARWCLDAVHPLSALGEPLAGIFLLVFLVCILRSIASPSVIVLSGWYLIGLVPVIFFPNHVSRYYLMYSVAPFIVLLVHTLRSVAGRHVRTLAVALWILCAVNLAWSTLLFARMDEAGFNTPTVEGSNNLTRKAALISMVRDFMEKIPSVPAGAVFVFDWLPTTAFCHSAGPQVWFHDFTLRATEIDKIHRDSHGIFLDPQEDLARTYVDSSKFFFITFHGDSLRFGGGNLLR